MKAWPALSQVLAAERALTADPGKVRGQAGLYLTTLKQGVSTLARDSGGTAAESNGKPALKRAQDWANDQLEKAVEGLRDRKTTTNATADDILAQRRRELQPPIRWLALSQREQEEARELAVLRAAHYCVISNVTAITAIPTIRPSMLRCPLPCSRAPGNSSSSET